MSVRTVSTLIAKDWHLHRIAVALTLVGSILAVTLVFLPGRELAGIGASMAIAILVSVTFYLPLVSVLAERQEKTITFAMSLPVSPSEYVASKILANVAIFLVPWLTVLAGVTFLPLGDVSRSLDSGWVPVTLVGIVLCFSIVLGFALITESSGWTVALIVTLLFVTTNVLTHLVPDTPAVREVVQSIADRGPAFPVALGVEVLAIVVILGVTFVAQARKRDFL